MSIQKCFQGKIRQIIPEFSPSTPPWQLLCHLLRYVLLDNSSAISFAISSSTTPLPSPPLSPYQTWPKIWTALFYYCLMCLEYCCMKDKQRSTWPHIIFSDIISEYKSCKHGIIADTLFNDFFFFDRFEVLWPSQPIRVMSSQSVYLAPLFLDRLCPLSGWPVFVHILLPENDNCPSWISRRKRMTIKIIPWLISTKECCLTLRGSNLQGRDLLITSRMCIWLSHWVLPVKLKCLIVLLFIHKHSAECMQCRGFWDMFGNTLRVG